MGYKPDPSARPDIDKVTENYELAVPIPEPSGGADIIAIWEENYEKIDNQMKANADKGTAIESRSVIAGDGLTGGGDLTTSRTLNVGSGTGITVNADNIELDTASTRNTDHNGVSIIAGTGLTGGGTITSSRTLTLNQATETAIGGAEIATTAEVTAGTDDTRIVTPLKLKPLSDKVESLLKLQLQGGGEITGGLIIKTGEVFATEDTGTTVTFDEPFPNSCWFANVNISQDVADNPGTDGGNPYIRTKDTTGLTIQNPAEYSTGMTVNWVAIGY